MKLAYSTLFCMDYTPKEHIAFLKKHSAQGVEVRVNNDNTFTHGDGMPITNIGSSICLRGYNESVLADAKKLLKSIEACNIKAMRVFLGNFCVKKDAPRQPIDHAGIVKMLQEMCDCSKVEIWVETHNEYSTGKVLSNLVKDVDRDNFKIIWDIVHPIEEGESPEDTLKYLGDRIAHVHIKDAKPHKEPIWHDYEYTPLGEGVLPIKKVVKLLEDFGYDGYFSLEWESLWRDELKALSWSADEIMSKFMEFMK